MTLTEDQKTIRRLRKRIGELEGEMMQLRYRLMPAVKLEKEVFLGSYPKSTTALDGTQLQHQIDTARRLGFTSELRVVDGAIHTYAVRWINA
jgi:hypothetical protein